jgi:hypothetical protein
MIVISKVRFHTGVRSLFENLSSDSDSKEKHDHRPIGLCICLGPEVLRKHEKLGGLTFLSLHGKVRTSLLCLKASSYVFAWEGANVFALS